MLYRQWHLSILGCLHNIFKLLFIFTQSTLVFACHGTVVPAQHRGWYKYISFHQKLSTAGTECSSSAHIVNSQHCVLFYGGAICCVASCVQLSLVWEGLENIAGELFFTFTAMGNDPDGANGRQLLCIL